MNNGSNDIELLKRDIHIANEEVKKYMESIKEEYKEVGRKIVDSYYTLELGINKPLPLRNDEGLAKTWRSDGRNQLMKKIFENLNLNLEAFYADFIINELKDLLKSTDVYVEVMDDGAFVIYEDIKDKDDYFIAYLNYNLEYKECNSNRLYYKN